MSKSRKFKLDSWTGLHEAALAGDVESVRTLLVAGEDVAARYGPDGSTPLHIAARENHIEVARVLLDAGAPLEDRDRYGNTPLWRAVLGFQGGEPDLIRLLLDRGANPDAKNDSGNSPRDVVLTFRRPGIDGVFPGAH